MLSTALFEELSAVGAPTYGPEAVAVAREIQREVGIEPMDEPFLDECSRLISPQDAEAGLREMMPAWQRNWTSDDYVEMTHYAPTVRFYVSRPALKGDPAVPYPAWTMNAMGGIPATIDPTIETAGKTVAGVFLRLLTSPEELAAAKAEFDERTDADPCPALLPVDFEAPIDLPWPDYPA